jgi:hypothetical protein
MSIILEEIPCAKGPVPYALDQCSTGKGARDRLAQLSEALKGLRPAYQGLELVFDTHLISRIFPDSRKREAVKEHLRESWFDERSPKAYFPGQQVAHKYAEAVIKTLELSLNGKPDPVPINAWWVIGANKGTGKEADKEVRFLNFAEVDNAGVTVSESVTLLILTPMPPLGKETPTAPVMGNAQAWVTELAGRKIVTRQIRKIWQGRRK